MNHQSNSEIEKPWWKPSSLIRGENIGQTKDQTVNSLLWFFFFCIGLAYFFALIQYWVIPAIGGNSGAPKDILILLLSGSIGVKFGYKPIRDIIQTEFDAGTESLEREVEARLMDDMQKNLDETQKIRDETQKMLEKIDKSTIQYNLNFKYIAHIKSVSGSTELQLSGVSSKLIKERGENSSKFGDKLDERFKENKNIREVRCKIYSLTDEFLKQLAFLGIRVALNLGVNDANEETKSGNDLHFLSLDVYAYLSAWLICSIDNDMGIPMPIACIGMRYTRGGNIPDKETYKDVIQAIKEIIVDGSYTDIDCYKDTGDPLSSDFVKHTIVDRLDKLIYLIKEYPV
jgi:hypothetical protein